MSTEFSRQVSCSLFSVCSDLQTGGNAVRSPEVFSLMVLRYFGLAPSRDSSSGCEIFPGLRGLFARPCYLRAFRMRFSVTLKDRLFPAILNAELAGDAAATPKIHWHGLFPLQTIDSHWADVDTISTPHAPLGVNDELRHHPLLPPLSKSITRSFITLNLW
jgi:hypothetical protein